MKNRIARLTVFGLAACLLLTLPGCASILERSYSSSTPHVDRPATAGDSSAIRVENYRELVSAVPFLVSQGEEEGAYRLSGGIVYPGTVISIGESMLRVHYETRQCIATLVGGEICLM